MGYYAIRFVGIIISYKIPNEKTHIKYTLIAILGKE